MRGRMRQWFPLRSPSRESAATFQFSAILCVLGLFSRLLAIRYPPTGFLYTTDELDVANSSLDRLLGLPTVIPMEPTTIVQALMGPIWLMDYILTSGVPTNSREAAAGLARYLAYSYEHPRHAITLVRVLVAVLCSVSGVFAYLLVKRLGGSDWRAFGASLLLLTHPSFFVQSSIAAGDAVAVTLALAALVALSGNVGERRNVVVAGLLFGTAVGAKLIIASAIVLFSLIIIRDKASLKNFLAFAAATAAGVLFWVPWLWTDPLRFIKSVYGTIYLKPDSRFDLEVFYDLWLRSHGTALAFVIPMVLAFAAATAMMKPRWKIAALIGFAASVLPVVNHTTTSSPNYLLPLLLPLLIMVALLPIRDTKIVSALLMVTVVSAGTVFYRAREARADDGFTTALRSIPAVSSIAVPRRAMFDANFDLPESYYQRATVRVWTTWREAHGLKAFLATSVNIAPEDAAVLAPIFNEDEQSDGWHLLLAARFAKRSGPPDVFVYSEPGHEDDAVRRNLWFDMRFREALASHTVLALCQLGQDRRLIRRYGKWCWYSPAGVEVNSQHPERGR
jgi:hypothetical protein